MFCEDIQWAEGQTRHTELQRTSPLDPQKCRNRPKMTLYRFVNRISSSGWKTSPATLPPMDKSRFTSSLFRHPRSPAFLRFIINERSTACSAPPDRWSLLLRWWHFQVLEHLSSCILTKSLCRTRDLLRWSAVSRRWRKCCLGRIRSISERCAFVMPPSYLQYLVTSSFSLSSSWTHFQPLLSSYPCPIRPPQFEYLSRFTSLHSVECLPSYELTRLMNLRVLTAPETISTSLNTLATLTNLQELRITRELRFTDEATSLANLPYLTRLDFIPNPYYPSMRFVPTFPWMVITLLTQLRRLRTDRFMLQYLPGLTNLTDLHLYPPLPIDRPSPDSTVLLALTNVTRLRLSDPHLIPVLNRMTQLRYLDLSRQMYMFPPSTLLSTLTNLETFLSPSILAYDLSPFKNLTRLSFQNKSDQFRQPLNLPLPSLANLTSLGLRHNSVFQNSVMFYLVCYFCFSFFFAWQHHLAPTILIAGLGRFNEFTWAQTGAGGTSHGFRVLSREPTEIIIALSLQIDAGLGCCISATLNAFRVTKRNLSPPPPSRFFWLVTGGWRNSSFDLEADNSQIT